MRTSTVHRVLRRHGAQRLSHLFPKPPRSFGHFDVQVSGELVAMDTKALGRLDRGGGRHPGHNSSSRRPRIGWAQLHVAIDLASRLVIAQVRPTTGNVDTIGFLEYALGVFAEHGIRVQRLLNDNGPGYKQTFYDRAAALDVRHTRTKPHHPWTNGRVERFNGTIQRECLYAKTFHSNDERDLAIAAFVAYYNAERPHIGLGGFSPLEWLRRNGT